MNRTGFGTRMMAALAAVGLVSAGAGAGAAMANTKADVPRSVVGYLALKQANERKRRRDAQRRPGETPLRGPVWPWLHKLGHIVSMGTRPHCRVHLKRFKHLRVRYVLEDETSGIRRSIKARTFGCPTCLRA